MNELGGPILATLRCSGPSDLPFGSSLGPWELPRISIYIYNEMRLLICRALDKAGWTEWRYHDIAVGVYKALSKPYGRVSLVSKWESG